MMAGESIHRDAAGRIRATALPRCIAAWAANAPFRRRLGLTGGDDAAHCAPSSREEAGARLALAWN